MKKRTFLLILTVLVTVPALCQKTLTLQECRRLATENSKELAAARLQHDAAVSTMRAARTKYLPSVDAMGTWQLTSQEVSILNDEQKGLLSNIGTGLMSDVGQKAGLLIADMKSKNIINENQAQYLTGVLQQKGSGIANSLNKAGETIKDAFRTDTHSMFGASIMVTQPLYMGGAIDAGNRLAEIGEQVTMDKYDALRQTTLYSVDQTYWLVVSLKNKEQLAKQFVELLGNLSADVHKMIDGGVATKAEGLSVDVKKNEAEMTLSEVQDGLALAKMLLCKQCGLPIDGDITLADEGNQAITASTLVMDDDLQKAMDNRPELRLLQDAVDASEQTTLLTRAAGLPQVVLTGGYLLTNPSVYNGFEKKFRGNWNIGVTFRIPVWSWNSNSYKVSAAKTATAIARLQVDEAKEKIELQVNQCRFKLKEANRRLASSRRNIASAEENLRCANVGFREGVMPAITVLEAHTAWMAAKTKCLDAEIAVKMAEVEMNHALGTME